MLFTSIPYENGFKVYVDDKLVDNYKVLDTFLAIDLEKGNHKIEIHYEIPGLKLGIIISAVSFIILIFYVKRKVM